VARDTGEAEKSAAEQEDEKRQLAAEISAERGAD